MTINENTFVGPNQGNPQGYIPDTIIESAKMDADMLQILADLNKLLSAAQTLESRLNEYPDPSTVGPMTPAEIVNAINTSTEIIDSDNLASDVITEPELDAAIEAHRVNTTFAKMHPETSIRSTELTYSNTPTSLITSCINLLDEIKNIRYQINRLNGKTYWSDTPVTSLSALFTALNTDITNLTNHIANMDLHLTPCQNAAADNAHSPCANNPFATINDIATHGNGDMLRSVYDKDKDGVVDVAETLKCACGNKSYTDIVSKIATDIDTHKDNASAHHTRYTNAEAIGAINGDADHSKTAKHYYKDLLGVPKCSELTDTEVSNIQSSLLANGTAPWSNAIMSIDGSLPANKLPVEVITSEWTENANNVVSDAYFSATVAGEVSYTFTGPCLIYGGFGTVTQHNGYLQYSVDNGVTWKYCSISPLMAEGPFSDSEDIYTWVCPFMYIPTGNTYKIRAGTSYSGTSEFTYGAGFNIRYKRS